MIRFALSTAWHAPRVTGAIDLFALPAHLGFDGIELSSVGAARVERVRYLDPDGVLPVVSLHAPCPVP